MVENGSKRSIKAVCTWSTKDKATFLECSVTLNHQLEIVGEKFVTSIGLSNEFYVNLLFDCSIYRPMCTHIWVTVTEYRFKGVNGPPHRVTSNAIAHVWGSVYDRLYILKFTCLEKLGQQ